MCAWFAIDETPTDHGDGWVSLGRAEREQMIEHRDGVPWHKAPVPARWHRCTAQTRGLLMDIERCACGASRYRHGPGDGWFERNSRKRTA